MTDRTTQGGMNKELLERPNCDICGRSYFQHMEIMGVGRVCPVSAVTYRAPRSLTPKAYSGVVTDRLFAAIAHGDDDHRAWLKEAIEAFYADKLVPPPRGLGNKEARIAELEAQLLATQAAPATNGGLVEQVAIRLWEAAPSSMAGTFALWNECDDKHTWRYLAKVAIEATALLTKKEGDDG